MKAGRLNSKIIIESKSEVIDAVGDTVNTWATFATVWTDNITQTGREFIQAKEQHSELSHIFYMRWLDGVLPDMRVNDNGSYYNIYSVIPDNRRREMRLYCDIQL